MQSYETVVMEDLGFFQDAGKIVLRLKRQGIDATEAAGHILVHPDQIGRARQLIADAQVAISAREDAVEALGVLGIAAALAGVIYVASRLLLGPAAVIIGGVVTGPALVAHLMFPRRWAKLGMVLGGIEGLGVYLLLRLWW